MLIRIDTDLFVNVNQIFSYKLYDEGDSYKLTIWSNSGQVVHTVFYVKSNPARMALLLEIVNAFKELTINPDRSLETKITYIPDVDLENINFEEEPVRHIKETISTDEDCEVLED